MSYNTHEKTKIYLFDLSKNRFLMSFSDKKELVYRLAILCCTTQFKRSILTTNIFKNINMNGNDTIHIIPYNEYGETQILLRPYMFIDEKNRIIDVRLYTQEINNVLNELLSTTGSNENDIQYGDWLFTKKYCFRYRIDPIPALRKHHRKNCVRHIRTMNELRHNLDPENQKYVRAKRKNLPTFYDDIPRFTSKSWKDQSKKKKQYL